MYTAVNVNIFTSQSDEVYDDGEDYTIINYKLMADEVAKKWRARDPPAQKPRAAPRYEPMVRAPLVVCSSCGYVSRACWVFF